jgi:hypothetical protein
MLALNLALDRRWLDDGENRQLFGRLVERLKASVANGAQ